MTEFKTIKYLKSAMLLSMIVLFGSFSLVEYYDVIPNGQLEKEQTSDQKDTDESSYSLSAYEAIVPVINNNILQAVILVFTRDVIFEIDLLFCFEVPYYQSEYQRLLFSRIIAPNAP